MQTMEEMLLEQIDAANIENELLKAKLEATQAVVDELLLGGTL